MHTFPAASVKPFEWLGGGNEKWRRRCTLDGRKKKIQGVLILLGRCSISINHDLPHDLALHTLVLNSAYAEG